MLGDECVGVERDDSRREVFREEGWGLGGCCGAKESTGDGGSVLGRKNDDVEGKRGMCWVGGQWLGGGRMLSEEEPVLRRRHKGGGKEEGY